METKHPIPSRLRDMADKFEHIYNTNPEARVDFARGNVCGSVACHGGWAGVALNVSGTRNDHGYFEEGADALSRYLFDDENEDCGILEHWAKDNPAIWGCDDGWIMFDVNGHLAFDQLEECTLKHIADWYRGVADRIEALDND